MLSSTDLLIALPDCLEEARVKSLPSSVYYIADFITKDEEIAILTKVVSVGP
jgi:alkylated DNA repair protein alkB family protein 6